MLNISYVVSLCKRSRNPDVWIDVQARVFEHFSVQRLKKKPHGLGLLWYFSSHPIFAFIPPEPILFVLLIFWLFSFYSDLFIFASNIKNMKNYFYTIFIFFKHLFVYMNHLYINNIYILLFRKTRKIMQIYFISDFYFIFSFENILYKIYFFYKY